MTRNQLSDTSTRYACENCGTVVSADFARVFGDNDDTLYRCPDCSSLRDLMSGDGAHPE